MKTKQFKECVCLIGELQNMWKRMTKLKRWSKTGVIDFNTLLSAIDSAITQKPG